MTTMAIENYYIEPLTKALAVKNANAFVAHYGSPPDPRNRLELEKLISENAEKRRQGETVEDHNEVRTLKFLQYYNLNVWPLA